MQCSILAIRRLLNDAAALHLNNPLLRSTLLAATNPLRSVSSDPGEETSAIDTPQHTVVAKPEELEKVLPISHELGELRRRSLETKGITVRYAVPAEGITPPNSATRRPSQSWLEMTYPFSASQTLREQYQRFKTPLIRMGLILEDVDGFAGDIAHRHVDNDAVKHVTASVDKITWLQSPPEGSVCLSRDLRLTGQVSWTGNSSMEVLMEAHTRGKDAKGWEFAGLARFVMVAQDIDSGAAVKVPALQPETKQQQNLFTLGHYNREVRKRKRETSLHKAAPTGDEVAMLHSLMKSYSGGMESRAVTIASTRKQSVRLMNSQDRNVSQRMYGGYLLREAFELAFATAILHAQELCEPISMEDVAFLQPVQIGSIVEFSAQVTYVSSPMLRVNVRASTLGKEAVVTNDFTIAFKKQKGAVTPVLPYAIPEAWLYIHGYRQHLQEQQEKAKAKAAALMFSSGGRVDREL